jgi:hypothetical protein
MKINDNNFSKEKIDNNKFNERQVTPPSPAPAALEEITMFNKIENIPSADKLQELINSLNTANISSLAGNKEILNEVSSNLDSITKLLTPKPSTTSTTDINAELTTILTYVTNINLLKNQLTQLPFNPFERIYVENCITPLLTIFYELAIAAASYKDTSQSLSNSTTTRRKTHKIKKYERTTYRMMDQITCLYDLLDDRICDFINIICKCK